MRVLFVQDNGINESLALTEAGAVLLARGHTTHLLIERDEPKLDRAIAAYAPDLVVLPLGLGLDAWSAAMVPRIKAVVDAPVFIGGAWSTLHPEQALQPGVDGLIIGEAEITLGELADALQAGRPLEDVEGLGLHDGTGGLHQTPRRRLSEDLDALPLPDRYLYYRYPYIRALSMKRFVSGRGCTYDCTFCFNSVVRQRWQGLGRYIRRKSPERTAAEVNAVRAVAPLRIAHFSDDLFVTDRAWLRGFAEVYPRVCGVPFTCNSAADLIDEETAGLLARAGCVGVAIGVEIGNEQLRAKLLNKRIDNDGILAAGRCIKANGMRLATFNLVGIPGATLDDELSTIELNQRMGTDVARVTSLVPVPGTAVSQMHSEGRRNDDDAFSLDSEHQRVLNLFRLAVLLGIPTSRVRRLARLPVGALTAALPFLLSPWGEKLFFEIGLIEGLRYFARVGNPSNRTTNFHTLI